jgi:hypothetical protein
MKSLFRPSYGVLGLLILLAPGPRGRAQMRVLDDFEVLRGWTPVTSHGDASRLALAPGEGQSGKGMVMDFSFLGHMGSAAAEKRLGLELPANYQISFDLRAEAPVNNFILRFLDSLDNVWIVIRSNYTFPTSWTRFTIRKDQIKYGWGPAGRGELKVLDRLLIMIDVVEGGKGRIWIDNLAIEPLDETRGIVPAVTASSFLGKPPTFSTDGRRMSAWRSRGQRREESLTFDFGRRNFLGGAVIEWDTANVPRSFDVEFSDDGLAWRTGYAGRQVAGARSNVYLESGAGRYMRLTMTNSRTGAYGIAGLELKGPEFSFSITDFFAAIAAGRPRGYYPKYLVPQQSYWTVVGVAGDSREALINEQGMIETDREQFSLEPFLWIDRHLVTWNDATIAQSLDSGYLPIPSVRWSGSSGIDLVVKACASGEEEQSVLYVQYTIRNSGTAPRDGKLFIAFRPFQVNPPWQTFTIVGGPARIDSISCGGTIRINRKDVVPVTRPDRSGAATFDMGDITDYLERGRVPDSVVVSDHFGYASGAMAYDFSLRAGEERKVVVAVPFHDAHPPVPARMRDGAAAALFDRECDAASRFWRSKLDSVRILLPPSAAGVSNAIRSNLAYALINADGPALQPGSRSYERSWLRDGVLTSTALLEFGVSAEVRRYLDWYAGYQYPDGAIPCIVEARGADPTPEHDSHGEFIYGILQYFRFTRDTSWLAGTWERVAKTAEYIRLLRGQRKTEAYRSGTPELQSLYGLVPESISHEGYCPKPMHSYWDDFFALKGVKDAAAIAGILGKRNEARALAAEEDDFRRDIFASMRMVIRNKHIPYIPSCADLGDLDPAGTTIAVMPCGELDSLPAKELRQTFDTYYDRFMAKRAESRDDAWLPYEGRAIETFLRLGRKDRALDMFNFFMGCRRPEGWNVWAEVIHKDRNAPKGIGDMPHSWGASDLIRAMRTMLAYERESDGALVIGAGVPESWVRDPAGVSVEHLPTYAGSLSYTMRGTADTVTVTVSGVEGVPVIVASPYARRAVRVLGGAHATSIEGEFAVDALPAKIVLVY